MSKPDNKIPNDAKDRFILRFHGEGQRSEIKARAALNKRSMNAEILLLIEQALAASKPCPATD